MLTSSLNPALDIWENLMNCGHQMPKYSSCMWKRLLFSECISGQSLWMEPLGDCREQRGRRGQALVTYCKNGWVIFLPLSMTLGSELPFHSLWTALVTWFDQWDPSRCSGSEHTLCGLPRPLPRTLRPTFCEWAWAAFWVMKHTWLSHSPLLSGLSDQLVK